MTPIVVAVSKGSTHSFTKPRCRSIELLAGLGIRGDAHAGATVKHRSRVRVDPTQPNLRQVHLLHEELLDELKAKGFHVECGSIGENVTTRGIDLLALPRRTRLEIGLRAVIEITGLRNPCKQLDDYQPGLLSAVLERRSDGTLIRKAGIMGVVVADGVIQSGDVIRVTPPPEPHEKLDRV